MKTEKEIKERIKDITLMNYKDGKNQELYQHWLDALRWVLEE